MPEWTEKLKLKRYRETPKSDAQGKEKFVAILRNKLKNAYPRPDDPRLAECRRKTAEIVIEQSWETLELQVDKLNHLEATVGKYETDLAIARSDQEQTLKDLNFHRAKCADQARELRDYSSAISRKDEHISYAERQMRQAEEEHRSKAETLRQSHDREISQLLQSHEATVHDLNQKHTAERSGLVETHKEKAKQLVLRHKQSTERLRQEVQELNAALLTRDDEIYQGGIFNAPSLPRKPDDKIKNAFVEIQQMIEDISRLDWKAEQDLWTEELFHTIGNRHVPRMVKNAILQDAIWSLLYRYVFCSPFRIFGDVGQELEKEWNEQCGKGTQQEDRLYTWPAPGVKTERWRYMTMKESKEALMIPLSQLDRRARLKRGYKSNQDQLVTELTAQLGDLVDLASSDRQSIVRVAKKAFSVWLDFEMHRCRIVVQLKGPECKSMAEKVALVQTSTLTLTIAPSLGRHGNVQGMELEEFTTIEGCAGESLVIP